MFLFLYSLFHFKIFRLLKCKNNQRNKLNLFFISKINTLKQMKYGPKNIFKTKIFLYWKLHEKTFTVFVLLRTCNIDGKLFTTSRGGNMTLSIM